MPANPYQEWVEKTANYSVVLASGVSAGPRAIAVKSFSELFTDQQIRDVLQRLPEIALGLRVYQISSSRMRWIFEHGQFHISRRPDGATALLATGKGPEASDAIEELFAHFNAIVAPLFEKPGLRPAGTEGPTPPPDPGGSQ